MQIVANEKTQRGLLVQGIHRNCREMFLDMWLEDLDTAPKSTEHLILLANGILKYFKSPLTAVAVDWDDNHQCFIWLFEKN